MEKGRQEGILKKNNGWRERGRERRHDEKSWPALLRNTELMVRLQITD